jgi:hypothetical protein
MPEIFRLEGYVFFFYANEGNEPMHVHVRRGGGYAKFWLEPLELDYAKGLKTKEIVRAEIIITENLELEFRLKNQTVKSSLIIRTHKKKT